MRQIITSRELIYSEKKKLTQRYLYTTMHSYLSTIASSTRYVTAKRNTNEEDLDRVGGGECRWEL